LAYAAFVYIYAEIADFGEGKKEITCQFTNTSVKIAGSGSRKYSP
jgi:hypothetical protein